MKNMRTLPGCLSAVVVWLCLGFSPAQAQSPTEYVRGLLDRVMAIQSNDSLSQRERSLEVHQIIRSNFDFNEMARDILGSSYSQLSSGQREEFKENFGYLFQDSYTRMVLNFLRHENIAYKESSQQDGKARVATVIERPNENIPVTYLMHSAGGWKLYDVMVDGVSILGTYRNSFSNVIRTKGFGYLMDRMKEQRRGIE
jgi:phospholipid transport system substrate-binding protein